jgi:hypothetical protein
MITAGQLCKRKIVTSSIKLGVIGFDDLLVVLDANAPEVGALLGSERVRDRRSITGELEKSKRLREPERG